MITEKETVKCEAIFNEERTHRYLWKRVWDKDKPLACVIMINACLADCLLMETTTYLVVNNIACLEKYGGVEIVNIYSMLTKKLEMRWTSDGELFDSTTDTYIKKAAAECDTIILAWGTGVLNNQRIHKRIEDVLENLKPFKNKLSVITNGDDVRAVHPLTPAIRNQWVLSPFCPADIEPPVKKTAIDKAEMAVETEKTKIEETIDDACDSQETDSVDE